MLIVISVMTCILLPVQVFALWAKLGLAEALPKFWHRITAKCIGLRIQAKGELSKKRPLLLVANHLSWSDIVVLGSLARVCFIAKKEVSEIPFAGLLARLQRSVFVTREDKRRSNEQANAIAQRLVCGDVMVLFAEGTTGDGNSILDFKSSLMGAAQIAVREHGLEAVMVQPVSIAYTKCHGMKMGRFERARASWPGDVPLFPHAGRFIRTSAWDVEVTFLEPLILDEATRRQTISHAARAEIIKAYDVSVFR